MRDRGGPDASLAVASTYGRVRGMRLEARRANERWPCVSGPFRALDPFERLARRRADTLRGFA